MNIFSVCAVVLLANELMVNLLLLPYLSLHFEDYTVKYMIRENVCSSINFVVLSIIQQAFIFSFIYRAKQRDIYFRVTQMSGEEFPKPVTLYQYTLKIQQHSFNENNPILVQNPRTGRDNEDMFRDLMLAGKVMIPQYEENVQTIESDKNQEVEEQKKQDSVTT